MAMDLLGETLDLHCGGIDLVFPHHEDEIAQSEGATGKPFSRVWCHGEFLLTSGAKMAKRVGNVQNVQDLRAEGISAAAVRHLIYSTHYRQQLNLVGDALEAAMKGAKRIAELEDRLARERGGTPELAALAERLEADAREALFDDLNAPQALAALHDFVRAANAELDRGGRDAAALDRARSAFALVNGVLDVGARAVHEEAAAEAARGGEDEAALAARIEGRLAERKAARARGDFAVSDRIRDELKAKGIEIKDTAAGTVWRKG